MGSLALRPGDSLTILLDGFVNRLQDSQFPSFLLFKLRGFDFYPDGTFTHCSCQPSLDAHFPVQIPLKNAFLMASGSLPVLKMFKKQRSDLGLEHSFR
jgi:hypothetical protein